MNALTAVVALTCLLARASAGSSSCDIGQYWQTIPGALSWVSSGDAGVWGVNSAGNIWYRLGTYVGLSYSGISDDRNVGFSQSDGTAWVQVAGGLQQIDVGKDSVWGVINGLVFYRVGISSANPLGTGWVQVNGLTASQVSVSDVDAKVWAVERGTGVVYRRVGVSSELPGGSSWEAVPGIAATSVDVGGAGVWATTAAGEVYYRTGSRTDCQGSGWQLVPAPANDWNAPVPVGINLVVSGGGSVWAVTTRGLIYYRLQITAAAPTGTHWIQVPGTLSQISVSTSYNRLWGVQPAGNIWNRHQ